MPKPMRIDRQELRADYWDGHFRLHSVDKDPLEELEGLFVNARDVDARAAQRHGVLVVLSPQEDAFDLPLAFERWDSVPPDDAAAWQTIYEACVEVTEAGLEMSSTESSLELPEIPPGIYAIRICGRGFYDYGDPDAEDAVDEWRLQVWPAQETFPLRLVAIWSGPEGAAEAPALIEALKSIGQGAQPRSEELAKVRESLAPEMMQDVRIAAVETLSAGWSGDREVELGLRQIASKDKDIFVRVTALIGLAQGWPGAETLAILKAAGTKKVRGDREGILRWNSVREAAIIGADDPATLSWLKELASSDDMYVWREAFTQIGTGWNDTETLAWVQAQIAAADSSTKRGWDAYVAIAKGWAGDPVLLPWLFERAADPDPRTRDVVFSILGHWHDHPDLLPFLMRAAESRRDGDTARACHVLSRYWFHDSEVAQFVAGLVRRRFPGHELGWYWRKPMNADREFGED